MPQRYRVRGSLVALALLIGVLSSMSLWATEPATPVCQEQDLMTIHPILPHTGIMEGRGVRVGQHLRRMYCAAQRIMAEPTLARRLPYEVMRQDVARASEDLLTQLQQLATAASARRCFRRTRVVVPPRARRDAPGGARCPPLAPGRDPPGCAHGRRARPRPPWP